MLITFVRAIILYIIVLIVMRLMGKREIGQLQPFELAISIMIADLASIPMTETGIPIPQPRPLRAGKTHAPSRHRDAEEIHPLLCLHHILLYRRPSGCHHKKRRSGNSAYHFGVVIHCVLHHRQHRLQARARRQMGSVGRHLAQLCRTPPAGCISHLQSRGRLGRVQLRGRHQVLPPHSRQGHGA